MLNPSDDAFDRCGKLLAQAERYRLLAEIFGDPGIVAIAQECARELETEAAQEQRKSPGVTGKALVGADHECDATPRAPRP